MLLVREGLHGKDRPLVDANQMSADGTVALDWWFPSDDGKYVAYGTSASGSENSTLHVIETATGNLLPDTIEHARIAQVAWKKDNSGFYYGRNPKKGDVPEGDEVYYLHIFYHALGSDPAKDPLIWGEGRKKEEILVSQLPDDDDRWLLLTAYEGSAGKNELFLQDLKAGTPPVELTSGKDFHYTGEIFRGKLYITTNEDAPHFHLFVVDAANPARANWKEIIPASDAHSARHRQSSTEKSWPSMKKTPAHSSSFSISTARRSATSSFRAWARSKAWAGDGTAKKLSSDSSRSRFRLPSTRSSWPHAKLRCGTKFPRPASIPRQYEVASSGTRRKTAPRFRCSSFTKKD